MRGLLALAAVVFGAAVVLASASAAGNPTVCSVTRPTVAQTRHDCAQAAAKAAIVRKHGMQVNVICVQGATVYRWKCSSYKGPYLVTFAKKAVGWVVTVTP